MLYTTLAAGLVCLLSGLLSGFASKYGVLRYWWVAVKLLLNVVMSVMLLLVLLNPVRDISIGRGPLTELSTIFFRSAVAVEW